MANLLIPHATIHNIELVIFDKDGTLIDVHVYWVGMVGLRAELLCQRLGLADQHRLGLMDSMGINTDLGQLKPDGPVGIKKREIVMQAAVDYLCHLGVQGPKDLCQEIFLHADELSLIRLGELIKPESGLFRLMADLRASGVKIALATTDVTSRALVAIKHLQLEAAFDLVVGADQVQVPKPAPEMIELILTQLHTNPAHAVMVGDAVMDIMMGINAGLKASIGILSGITQNPKELRELTPYLVNTINDLEVF